MVDRKAVIKNADMSEDMQQDAIDCATQALEKWVTKNMAVLPKMVTSYQNVYHFVSTTQSGIIFIANSIGVSNESSWKNSMEMNVFSK